MTSINVASLLNGGGWGGATAGLVGRFVASWLSRHFSQIQLSRILENEARGCAARLLLILSNRGVIYMLIEGAMGFSSNHHQPLTSPWILISSILLVLFSSSHFIFLILFQSWTLSQMNQTNLQWELLISTITACTSPFFKISALLNNNNKTNKNNKLILGYNLLALI